MTSTTSVKSFNSLSGKKYHLAGFFCIQLTFYMLFLCDTKKGKQENIQLLSSALLPLFVFLKGCLQT